MSKPEIDIETKIGKLTVVANRAGNAFVKTKEGEISVIRGNDVSIHVHFWLRDNGKWCPVEPHKSEDSYEWQYHVTVKRADGKESTLGQMKAAREAAHFAIVSIYQTHRHLFRNAQEIENAANIELLREKLADLEKQKQNILAEIAILENA